MKIVTKRWTQLLLIVVCTLAVHQKTFANDWEWRGGIFAAATLNIHQGDFSSYDGLQGCGTFSDAITPGWTLGNLLDVRFDDSWGAMARLGYWQADGNFSDPAPVAPYVALSDGSLVQMVSEYELNTSLDVITLDLLGTYQLFPRFFIGLGPQLGWTTRAAFEQTETIVEPAGITFADGSTSRVILAAPFEQSGALSTTTNFRLGATLNLSYEIPLSNRIDLAPEVGGTFAFTDVLSSFDWSAHMVRAGVRLTYRFGAEDAEPLPPPPPAPEPAPMAAAPEPPYVLMDVTGVNESGNTEAVSEIVLTQAWTVDVMPLLPNIFFDSASATIPPRYVNKNRNATDFSPNAIDGDILDVYHNLLNIVGFRMNQHANATLVIRGHIEPSGGESDNALATQRANAVRDYLVQQWGIDASRLSVESRQLPQHPSNRNITDGREENRRVELFSDDLSILAPVRRSAARSKITPDPITIMPKVTPSGDADVKVFAADGSTLSSERVASGGTLTWKPSAATVATLLASGQRFVTIKAISGEGDLRREARQTIGLRRSTTDGGAESDTIRERHRLVFFDFDDDKISNVDAPYMEDLQARLRTTSKITVTGYTDRIGDEAHNTDLSTRRANRVANTIKQRIVPDVVNQRGAGPELIHDNNLPEGRMYNRTVIIDVATPRESLMGDE